MKKSIEKYLKEPYTYILIPDEMGGYAAEILEFPGCFAEGETANEAMKSLDRAAAAWIRAALSQGQEIPPPFKNQGYGGKIALRLPRSLHRQAARFAERDGVSLNQYLVSKIAEGIGAEEFSNQLTTQLLEKLKDHLSATVTRVTNITVVNYRSEMAGTSTQQLSSTNLRFNDIVAQTSGDREPVLIH